MKNTVAPDARSLATCERTSAAVGSNALDGCDVARLGTKPIPETTQVVLSEAVVLEEDGDLRVRAVAGDRLAVEPALELVIGVPAPVHGYFL